MIVYKLLLLPVFMLGLAKAISAGGGGGEASRRIMAEHDARLDNIRNFDRNGTKIPRGSQCEEILLEASKRLRRPLTEAEINANLDEILKATGEALVIDTQAVRRTCFTAEMMVSTPGGPRPIGELQVGDQVISIDLATKKPVMNRISAVHKYEGKKYSRLEQQDSPINVTDSHPFYSDGNDLPADFRPISQVPADANLFRVNTDAGPGEILTPVKRGCYVTQPGTATVIDLSLEGEPRNFIVEGLLVHNKTQLIM